MPPLTLSSVVLLLLLASDSPATLQPTITLMENYCIDCHDTETSRGDLNLEPLMTENLADHQDLWEKVLKRIDARQMPPAAKKKRPKAAEYESMVASLTSQLDAASAKNPDPGNVPAMRRLTRTEYYNAIRDLLGVEIDVAQLLPKDQSSHGFDNVTVGGLSSTRLDRYVSAAQKIARTAVGGASTPSQVRIVRVAADQTQEERLENLPHGTRGGVAIEHTFPATGDYEIDLRLTRDRNEEVEGLRGQHQVLVLVDGKQRAEFTVEPPPGRKDFSIVDANLKKRIRIEAGTRQLAATFLMRSRSLLETKRQPYDAQYNKHRHPRQSPAIFQVSINGPFDPVAEPASPARRKLFTRMPKDESEEETCAKEILRPIMRRAYRRPITDEDLTRTLEFFRSGRLESNFDAGLESALSSILVSPHFLFRIERKPDDFEPGAPYIITNHELASRLSFFLWSSLPDDELLNVADAGKLAEPNEIERQVKRMLNDPRAESLATNFANQWLQLRNLEAAAPDLRLFPDFDDNLRQSLIRETELFFADLLREDKSVVDLLGSKHTFLNERLARHYELPHIFGSHFRKVNLAPESHRGGLLRQGSILMVTSYANRTSPVLRGNWILENVLGTPTPPPPPDIPALEDVVIDANLPMRDRLAKHREDRSCATCHNLMDPPGFSLENFDAVGRWRERDNGHQVNAAGGLPDGTEFVGVEGLEQGLLSRPDLFARTITEKLLTYALGRGVEHHDASSVRKIVTVAAEDGYRFSDVIIGIAKSIPFNRRKTP